MNELKIPVMKTVEELAKISHIAPSRIRTLAKENKIVHVPCGSKILINLEKFIEFLNTYKGETQEESYPIGKIKPIKV